MGFEANLFRNCFFATVNGLPLMRETMLAGCPSLFRWEVVRNPVRVSLLDTEFCALVLERVRVSE